MAATIEEIMLGIETRLATISGLRVTEYVADQINPPQAVVGVPAIPNYRSAMARGSYSITPTVTVLVSAAVDRVGQLQLARYASPTGPSSVPAAIEGDRQLGATVHDCVVTAFRPLGYDEVGVIGYYGGVFDLTVIASGTP